MSQDNDKPSSENNVATTATADAVSAPEGEANNPTPEASPATTEPTFVAWMSPGEAAARRIVKLSSAIPESELLQINVVLAVASTTALGALPRIKSMREEFVRRVPNHDMTLYDAFEDIALALEYTDVKVRATKQEKKRLTVRAEELTATRDQLYDFVEGFAGYGLFSKAALDDLKKEFGYKPMLRDVSTLLEMIGQNWQAMSSMAPFTLEEMDRIAQDVLALRRDIGLQEQSPEGPRAELIHRRQVFTLFRRVIAEARKIAIYLYGEDAVGDYVPAFFNAPSKPRNGKGEHDGDIDSDDSDLPVVAPTNTASQGASTSQTAAQRPSGFVVNNPENLPITAPFIEEDDKKGSA